MGGMTGSLLLLLWAGVSASTMVDLQKRIINGQNCNDNDRLYHVKLIRVQTGGRKFCGGSLISDQWILTAAHCWEEGWTIEAVLRVHPGANQVTESINLNNIYKHGTADIMLLKLTTPQPGFPQIHLPNCATHPTPKNVMVQIAGHGSTTANPDKTRIPGEVADLKCADIKAIHCRWLNQNQYDQMFCGETNDITNPVGACWGDSGGGVVYDNKIYGVIHGLYAPKVCTIPDEFVGVCGYMQWIQDTMRNN